MVGVKSYVMRKKYSCSLPAQFFSSLFFNYFVWESANDFGSVFNNLDAVGNLFFVFLKMLKIEICL